MNKYKFPVEVNRVFLDVTVNEIEDEVSITYPSIVIEDPYDAEKLAVALINAAAKMKELVHGV